ncbi:uncharacterized protein LOC110937800 isoform X1 [Helianthus annuus]|uniref:Uncharacterized protein n=1 Tax=Helianthus annuus TaxID=4232 RepID=A0A251V1P4_HELAN|nr:uncharacterized protein LOC110890522 isoform X1 [Helianthus annuus]XP_021993835.1 uncharacterized protein LOC110890522 isoform X1 [Helianthus annuus]XP_021993836.1 uncharacterized protein LOC110890522 isoform X1 [Helianthus annuus]XP_021993837.1 uncharacterized protein LOC110890522 isoform X1 [Helianthus annuus]XP_021993838.1 uncharacterized protein LOC110890522 isoform X1 [Helianthus annuus]XP_022035946.1 uncharacterized protein LOC110937800 isoform X1 [Helianthus annuus]XP_022035947.1 un
MLSRMVMEQLVDRLDVAMFNAILRESAEEMPTNPLSDPIGDLRVLRIPAGKSSFGAGAQLKNTGADTPFNCVSNNLISEDTPAFKGTVSYTGDNQTPNDAADKSIGKRPVSSESNETKKDARLELKRNLKEVYDVEDNDCASATKASPTIQPIQVQDGKFDFLIPKLEK